ncbi:MAG TPA: glycosyltransferase [Flavobacteriales bacterium]|jgi:glycosyltransferase involved in cell wall biosynthesis/O-antigen ligase|nr:glycosyltransferase [Flavobacteriales bacterium]MBK8532544.1 glycosyltransferase [Flavobacteriales bacterium]MBK8708791.1 glycosyltransferase [Flavobacteriales bacterium]MBP8878976.1 glycosyltransferase [Flavobacteriales bacterium]HQW98404.1 glycosyltransferase [Flavobacteriales bacterium]
MIGPRLVSFSTVAFACTLPWWPSALPILLVLLLVGALLSPKVASPRPGFDGPLPWMALLYIWHALGMIWSSDIDFGLFDLGIKFALLAVPIVAWWCVGLDRATVQRALRYFVWACVFFTLLLIVRGSYLYASEYIDRITGHPIEGAPYYNHLFSSYLTWYVHPTYLAYYLVMALAAWTLADLHTPVSPTTSRIVLLVLALGIVLSSSKMGWIALSLLLPYVLFVNWGHAVLRRTILVTTVAAIGSFAVLYVTVGGVRGKVEEALAALKQEAPVAEDSSSARRQVWHAASELAIEAPWLGQGTGDVKNELIDRYDKHGYTYPLEHRLNAHSQFIQTLVALGIPGILLLFGSLLVPLFFALRRRQHLLIVLLVVTAINWSVESMLEVQGGVLSFVYFALLLTWKRGAVDGPPHIVLLTQYYPPETGAPQNRLHALAKLLVSKGAQVTVLTAMPNYPDMRIRAEYKGRLHVREELDGVTVHRSWLLVSKQRGLFWRLGNYFSFVFTSFLMGVLVLDRPKYLIVESPPLFLGITAMALAKLKSARMVFNVSDLWPESAVQLGLVKSPWMIKASTALEMVCYRNAALISGQTMGIVNNIKERCPDKEVVWIPNGVDLDLVERIRPMDRAQLGIPADAIVLVYAGIIGHAQGLEVILQAATRMTDPRVCILLVGDGPERSKLEALTAQLELRNVRFIDPMPRLDVLSLVAACDAAVIPLRSNPLFRGAIPSKIFEALALGRPILLGVDGEARKLFIEDGKGGLFFEPENADELARVAMQLIKDPILRTTLGEHGAAYVRVAFDRQRIGDRLWSALQKTSNSDLVTP